MAETYSLNVTAAHAGSKLVPQVVTLPDSAAKSGQQATAMRTGSQVQCKNPDGSLENYLIDAERTRPGGPVILLRTRP